METKDQSMAFFLRDGQVTFAHGEAGSVQLPVFDEDGGVVGIAFGLGFSADIPMKPNTEVVEMFSPDLRTLPSDIWRVDGDVIMGSS